MKRILCCLAVCVLLLVLYPAMPTQAEESAVQTVEVGIPVEEHPELFLTRSMPTHGEGKIAVFLIDFPDYPNENPVATREYYDKLYFSGGLETSWENTTVAEFYREQSYGKLNLSGQVFDWYTAKHERSYYDYRKAELVMEAAEYYRSQGVDFSQFDGDGDGVIDAITYHFAGEASSIRDEWYGGVCYSAGSAGFGQIGAVNFTTIVQVSEGARTSWCEIIKTICHELMHTLGMPDLYGKVNLNGTHAIDLMSGNSQTINPYTKMLLGWIETVQVITSDVTNIRLDPYGDNINGEAVIITDHYSGILDEFYMVAYRDLEGRDAIIWHVDARLSENGTTFMNHNHYYDPRPDVDTGHEGAWISPYLFIEELSADPTKNLVLNTTGNSASVAFNETSTLGPNVLPSSDYHDGRYTGICIHSFNEHNEEYLTFDVSFVKDNSAPTITTRENQLEFMEKIHIQFNEYVYAGQDWSELLVTDLDGNPLDVTAQLTHYPRNQIEISFQTDAYKNGYKIVLPYAAVTDSSGNPNEAAMLTASTERLFFPSSTLAQLPNPGYSRANTAGGVYFFQQDDGLVVITELWHNHIASAKIEIMQIDFDGNVRKQVIVDNPFEGSGLLSAYETGYESFILIFYNQNAPIQYLLSCVGADGTIKWTNDEYCDPGERLDERFIIRWKDGIVVRINTNNAQGQEIVHIRYADGKTQALTEIGNVLSHKECVGLSDGRILAYQNEVIGGEYRCRVAVVEPQKLEVVAEGSFVNELSDQPYSIRIRQAYANDDGTILIVGVRGETVELVLLDAELDLIRSVSFPKPNTYLEYTSWFENDGICYRSITGPSNHSNACFHVRRYDRYLNLIWETDVEANFVHYFKSPNGDILAYRSMWEPERECYIDYYGSEEAFRVPHVHELSHVLEIPATCQQNGSLEHWKCNLCGSYFSDKGITEITDMKSLAIPLAAHKETVIPAVTPTCTQTGSTEGKKCSVCGTILVAQKSLPKTDHIEQIVPAVAPTCTEPGASEWKKCAVCGGVITVSETIPALGHKNENQDPYCDVCGAEICKNHTPTVLFSKEPTCLQDGLTTGKKCSICGMILVAQETIPALGHTEEIVPAVEPTCRKTGWTEGRKCTDCGMLVVPPQEIPATGEHIYGEWKVIKEATCTETGTERRRCSCAKSETREIPVAHTGQWTVTKAATTDAEGEETRTCTLCGAEEVRAIPRLPAVDEPQPQPEPEKQFPVVAVAVVAATILTGSAAVILLRKKKT